MPASPSGFHSTIAMNRSPYQKQPGLGVRAEQVAREDEEHRADQRPPEAREPAADQHHHHDEARLVQAHHVRIGALLRHREQRAGEPGDRRRQHEHAELEHPHAIAEKARAHLVLPDACEHAARRRMHESPATEDDERRAARGRSRKNASLLAIETCSTPKSDRRSLQVQQAILAAGDRVPLDRDEPGDLSERDRQQRVVDAASMRDECRDQRPGERRRQHAAGEVEPEVRPRRASATRPNPYAPTPKNAPCPNDGSPE